MEDAQLGRWQVGFYDSKLNFRITYTSVCQFTFASPTDYSGPVNGGFGLRSDDCCFIGRSPGCCISPVWVGIHGLLNKAVDIATESSFSNRRS